MNAQWFLVFCLSICATHVEAAGPLDNNATTTTTPMPETTPEPYKTDSVTLAGLITVGVIVVICCCCARCVSAAQQHKENGGGGGRRRSMRAMPYTPLPRLEADVEAFLDRRENLMR
jgi:hypothetical protein